MLENCTCTCIYTSKVKNLYKIITIGNLNELHVHVHECVLECLQLQFLPSEHSVM